MGTGKNEEKHRKTWRIREKHGKTQGKRGKHWRIRGKHRETGQNIKKTGKNRENPEKT